MDRAAISAGSSERSILIKDGMSGTLKLKNISTDDSADRIAVITMRRVWLIRFWDWVSIFFVFFMKQQHLSFDGLSAQRKALRNFPVSQGVTYAGVCRFFLPYNNKRFGLHISSFIRTPAVESSTALPSVSESHRISFRARTNTLRSVRNRYYRR